MATWSFDFFSPKREPQELVFTIPIFEPLPSQYIIRWDEYKINTNGSFVHNVLEAVKNCYSWNRAMSERWLGSEAYCPMDFKHLILPERHPPHTDLLDLQPLSTSALKDPIFEQLYSFKYFNPIQTQLFHTLYHTEKNVLLGAPTGTYPFCNLRWSFWIIQLASNQLHFQDLGKQSLQR